MAKKCLPSIERLRNNFDYLPDIGVVLHKKSMAAHPPMCGTNANKQKVGAFAQDARAGMPAEVMLPGRARPVIKFAGEKMAAHRVAWALHYGEWPKGMIDHINNDPFDNRIENLRIATKAENARNRRSSENSTSKYLGVSKRGGKWVAQIGQGPVKTYLGTFDSEDAAALAYDCAAVTMHREFANPNIIENPYLTQAQR